MRYRAEESLDVPGNRIQTAKFAKAKHEILPVCDANHGGVHTIQKPNGSSSSDFGS